MHYASAAPGLSPLKRFGVYHIGNSLTDNIYYGGLFRIAQCGDDTYTYGKDVSPGVPLDDTWEGKTKTGSVYSLPPYGTYSNALKNYTWDAMTLEPFDNEIAGSTGDLQISEDFINLAEKKSPNIQTYIYDAGRAGQKMPQGISPRLITPRPTPHRTPARPSGTTFRMSGRDISPRW